MLPCRSVGLAAIRRDQPKRASARGCPFPWQVMAQPHADHMPSPPVRVGVDLVRISEVAASLARFGDRYSVRLFTPAERAYCRASDGRGRTAERFAARFAAKEATLKVLRPSSHDGIDWRAIEVRQLAEGACEIALHGSALALAHRSGVSALSVSMSHDGDYATATVIASMGVASNVEHQRSNELRFAASAGVRKSQSSRDA
jgi:holo-[acyl-carrier protein] synthase